MEDITEESLEKREGVGEMGRSTIWPERASRGHGRLPGWNRGVESALTGPADAPEAIEQVVAVSLVQARGRGALVCLYLTEPPF